MSYNEFVEWQEYYFQEPFFADRLESQIATLSYITSAVAGGKHTQNDFLISQKRDINITEKNSNLEKSLSMIFGIKKD